MFIQLNDERIINLYLLQNLRVEPVDDKYSVRFIFTNGETYDELYDTENAAETALESYITEILSK